MIYPDIQSFIIRRLELKGSGRYIYPHRYQQAARATQWECIRAQIYLLVHNGPINFSLMKTNFTLSLLPTIDVFPNVPYDKDSHPIFVLEPQISHFSSFSNQAKVYYRPIPVAPTVNTPNAKVIPISIWPRCDENTSNTIKHDPRIV